MNLESVERIANAMLYEGYILYPYRPSSVKNRKRFNFGVLVPPAYRECQGATEACSCRTECLVLGGPCTRLDVMVRFLQVGGGGGWQEAVEREARGLRVRLGELAGGPGISQDFHFPPIAGRLEVVALRLNDRLFRVSSEVSNLTPLESPETHSRDGVLPFSLVSTHTILSVRDGEFISLLDPPDDFREAASQCRNIGTWPVLAGDPNEPNVMLSSPIILYDYPQIAPESPGELFDGTEIDEILTLRILAMTEEEKREMYESDERARRILQRTETLSEEQLGKLHGSFRGHASQTPDNTAVPARSGEAK